MIKQEKEKVVQELTEKMKEAKAIYLTDFTGLDVVRATELRKKLRDDSRSPTHIRTVYGAGYVFASPATWI